MTAGDYGEALDGSESSTPRRKLRLPRIGIWRQQGGLILVIALFAAVVDIDNSVFLTGANVIEILRSAVLFFVAACPATLVMIGGGLDFSVGSLLAVGGVAGGWAMNHGVPWPLAVLVGLGFGATLGWVNGVLVAYFRIPPFIVTLGMYFAAGGAVLVSTSGNLLFGFSNTFDHLGQGQVLGVPYLIVYGVVVGLLFHVLLEYTPFGYESRAVGGNFSAAVANGIKVKRITISLYVISGAVAAFAGLLLAARESTASPNAGGASFTLQVLTAVIIGGTSLFGGVGQVTGTALGTLLFSAMDNGLIVMGIDPLWQNIAVGVILVVAVAADQARRRRRFRLDLR